MLKHLFTAVAVAGSMACSTHHVVTPRAAVSFETPEERNAILEARTFDPETVRLWSHLTARGESLIGRFSFDGAMVYQQPDRIRIRASRPVPGGEFLELIQNGNQLTLYFYKERRYFSGPLDTLDPQILREMPVDASWLVTVPLIDRSLAENLPSLERDFAPGFLSPWRRHLFLEGPPPTTGGGGRSGFDQAQWALDPETLTVEALALRLPPTEEEKALWLTLVFDAYEEFAGEEVGVASGESIVLPSEFHVSLDRRPWRRIFKGRQWSVEGEVFRLRLNAPAREQDFVWPPPAGSQASGLEELGLR